MDGVYTENTADRSPGTQRDMYLHIVVWDLWARELHVDLTKYQDDSNEKQRDNKRKREEVSSRKQT